MNGKGRRLSLSSRPALLRETSGSSLTYVELGLLICKGGILAGAPFPFVNPHTKQFGKSWMLIPLLKRHKAHFTLKGSDKLCC